MQTKFQDQFPWTEVYTNVKTSGILFETLQYDIAYGRGREIGNSAKIPKIAHKWLTITK